MPEIEMKLSVDPETIAKALAAMDPDTMAEFGRDLVEHLWHLDEALAAAFAGGVAAEHEEQAAA